MSNTPNLKPDGEARALKLVKPATQFVNFSIDVLHVPGVKDKDGQPLMSVEAKAFTTALQDVIDRAVMKGFAPDQAAVAASFWLIEIGWNHIVKNSGVLSAIMNAPAAGQAPSSPLVQKEPANEQVEKA